MDEQLRVSVYRQGRIVDERVVPPGARVAAASVGGRDALDCGRKVRGRPLFTRDGRTTVLEAAGERGEVALGGRPVPLPRGPVTLDDGARGWLDVGDARVFFQLLPPPAPTPKKVLGKDVRFGLRSNLERRFVAALAVVVVAELVGLWRLHQRAMPLDVDLAPDESVDAIPVFHLPRLGALTPAPPTPTDAPPRRTPAAARDFVIRNSPLLRALHAMRDGGPLKHVFAPEAPDVDWSVVRPLRPVASADPRQPHRTIEGPHVGGPFGPGGPPVDHDDVVLSEHHARPPPQISFDDEEGDHPALPGDVRARILAALKLRQGAVQRCYEKALKLDPSLGGRVTLRFSVNRDGSLDDVDVDDASLHSPETDECIVRAARAWRLEAHPDEAVTTDVAFVFSPRN